MIKLSTLPISDEEIQHYLINKDDFNEKISSQSIFKNNNPLHFEIGCGNGHFLSERSEKNQNINYIGIDISRKRVIKSIVKVNKRHLENVRYLLGEGKDTLANYFADSTIQTCYVNFPDPWPKRKHHKNRLIKPEFLTLLAKKMEPAGFLIAATDHEQYFFEMLKFLEQSNDFFNTIPERYLNHFENYETSLFEEKWRSMDKTIFYLQFQKRQKFKGYKP